MGVKAVWYSKHASTMAFVDLLLAIALAGHAVSAYLSPQNPPWPPTYNLLDSLISMQCNSSGLSSPERGAEFGIISYDWSNAKSVWAETKPMNCEELLVEQVERTKKRGGKHIFVYRNIVKALPWFSSVREKLNDPNYQGFFLKFDPRRPSYHVPACAAENQTLCSELYHDQQQTPQVPNPSNEDPDGSCLNYCDCGNIHPCGEYLFDHRNGTMLREWIVQEIILGETAVGHPSIDGLFLDDFWCSDLLCRASHNQISGCPCNDPVQGPTEIDKFSQLDIGLSDKDIYAITIEWNKTMKVVQQALLQHGAYTWSLISGQENANASPFLLSSESEKCIESLRLACNNNSIWQRLPMLFGFSVNGTKFVQLEQDLAFFLLVRGPYTFAGFGVWGMTWPFNPEPRHGQIPPLPHGVPLPQEFYYDYGVPINNGHCFEKSRGVFFREWTKVTVKLDCTSFSSNITLIEKHLKNSDKRNYSVSLAR